ncbi:MAG: PAS domain S-box protein [Thermodesulfobacteriota bacterium]
MPSTEERKTKTERIQESTELRRKGGTIESLEEGNPGFASNLRESEEKYRHLVERAYVGFGIGQDGVLKYVNPSLAEMVGYGIDELIGKPFVEFFVPEEAPRILNRYHRRLAGEEVPPLCESAFKHKDGKRIEVELNAGIITYQGRPADMVIVRDVTERKRAEETLRISEERFRIAAESSNDFIYEWDIESDRLEWFDSADERLQAIFEEIPVAIAAFAQYIHPDDYGRVSEAVRRQVRYGEPYNEEYRLIGKKGNIIYIKTAGRCLRDEKGRAYKWIGATSDITERKQAEEAQRQAEENFRAIVENAVEGIFQSTPDGKFLMANKALAKMLAYDSPEQLIESVEDSGTQLYTDQADRERARKILAQEGELKNFEAYVQRKDGERIWVNLNARLVRDTEGKVLFYEGTAENITESKQAEEALRQAEEKYRSIVENAVEGIFQTTVEGRFLMINSALARFHGYDSPEEMKAELSDGDSPLYVHPEDRQRYSRIIEEQGMVSGFETPLYTRDKNIKWGSLNVRAVKDGQGQLLYYEGTIEDITARKEAEEGLRKTMEGIVQAMALTVEQRDPYTAGHQRRVAGLAEALACNMGLPEDQVNSVRMAGIVHDIGKIAIPAEILSKPTKLSDIEFKLIMAHPQTSYDILKDIDFPWPLARIVLQHHERLNGSGYPKGLSGNAICFEARLLAVADVVEAISSHRPYRPAYSIETALEEVEKHKGSLYDKEVVEACLKLFREGGYTFD